ncbi:methyl-accepting chemotaxis protein [Marinobacter sp. X15-166B]|uniref:methyl-accepting chemotaxis protein n=1 Tax=Marinobacter sp. X15-166B TaxID=1897620 RepID=UPI00085C0237|nr:methyl-accepting chemotaxis protein [Marinobacter sp. X15-166B]OEY67874.1 chemotaxis protein [Marinobacter sp. X15-166B]
MKLNLSWRQKFLILITLTPIGLALIAWAIIYGLQTVSSAYQSIYEVSRYENGASNLATKWNAVEKQLSNLSQNNQTEILARLAELSADAAALENQATRLADPDTLSFATAIREHTERYASLRQVWLQQMNELGLSETEGLRHELAESLAPLRNMRITLIEQVIADIVSTSNAYIDSRTPALADGARQALQSLEEMVEQNNWHDNIIGSTTLGYSEIYARVDDLVQRLAATESSVAQAGDNLQQQVVLQSESLQSGLIARTLESAESAAATATRVSIGSILVFAPLLVLVLFLTSRTLVSQLNRVVELLSRVSGGDLSQKLELGHNPNDEFNLLGRATNQMIDDIGTLMRDSIAGTRDLIEVHGELDNTIVRLAQNGEVVESQTILAAAASQQIAVTLNDVAERTSQVGVATHAANDSAQTGAQIVENSVTSMRRLSTVIQDTHGHVKLLNDVSSKVTGIISVINGLADQTNLLALNAAIEAARAGDAGRGFSVVADEVRTLAQQTVAATTNIAAIIDELNAQTMSMDALATNGLAIAQEGEQHASEIADTMTTVTESIQSLNAEMDQVVVAVEEISVTTEDIAQKMEEIRGQSAESQAIGDELSRQNQRLSEQANVIATSTRRFNV